jgi:hypothetical protein
MYNELEQLSFIAQKISDSEKFENSGLLSGKMGQAIIPDCINHACRLLDSIQESLRDGELYHSHCEGIGLTLLSIYQHKIPLWSKFLLLY